MSRVGVLYFASPTILSGFTFRSFRIEGKSHEACCFDWWESPRAPRGDGRRAVDSREIARRAGEGGRAEARSRTALAETVQAVGRLDSRLGDRRRRRCPGSHLGR